jgi:hypothetical protein
VFLFEAIRVLFKVFSMSSANDRSFLWCFQTQEFQIFFLTMQHFELLNSVSLGVFGGASLA